MEFEFLLEIGRRLRAFALALGGPGLMLIATADSSFLSLPEANDILIVVLSSGQSWERMFYYVSMTILGSLIGCIMLFTVGRKGGEVLLRKRFSGEKIAFVEGMIKKYGVFAILVPCMLPPPMPFKIFVLSSGIFGLKTSHFLAAVAVGRTVRYSTWGILAVLYGERVKRFMEQNLHTVGTVLVLALALFLLAVITFKLCYARRQARRGLNAA